MINSMTGFGAADGLVGGARVSVEVRSVNHRFFTPTIKLPSAYSKWEADVREILRKRVQRGHITLFARTGTDAGEVGALIDAVKLERYLAELRGIQEKYSLAGDIDVATILRLPNLFGAGSEQSEEGSPEELGAIVSRAVTDLLRMRQTEGAQVGRYLEERLAELKKTLARVGERAPRRLKEQHAKLQETMADLMADKPLDESRIAQEVAILAERLDVAEEIDRFNGHIAAFVDTIRSVKGEPVGKRLGFLLQEMVREANTLGSKANDSAILSDVIVLKEELERMREQVENVE
ncbi:MAG: YicC family protein [Gemmatimonadaceae bacterium]|nr:YicC family protein [Gemmatimonadaceae bacterium]